MIANAHNYFYLMLLAPKGVLKQSGSLYWTSGFKDADCNLWCSNSGAEDVINPSAVTWLQKSAANATFERCVAFELNDGDPSKSGLKFVDCYQNNLYVCEVKYKDVCGFYVNI